MKTFAHVVGIEYTKHDTYVKVALIPRLECAHCIEYNRCRYHSQKIKTVHHKGRLPLKRGDVLELCASYKVRGAQAIFCLLLPIFFSFLGFGAYNLIFANLIDALGSSANSTSALCFGVAFVLIGFILGSALASAISTFFFEKQSLEISQVIEN